MRPEPDAVGPDQESVWDYPRPPRLEPTDAHLVVVLGGVTIADSRRAYRVLETSHPPNYYFPPDDVRGRCGRRRARADRCASSRAGRRTGPCGAGSAPRTTRRGAYATPSPAFAPIKDHLAFYAGRMDACFVDGEAVTPQPGGFYGGWITAAVAGPFKGGPGSRGW